jgi:hypothetical protein
MLPLERAQLALDEAVHVDEELGDVARDLEVHGRRMTGSPNGGQSAVE